MTLGNGGALHPSSSRSIRGAGRGTSGKRVVGMRVPRIPVLILALLTGCSLGTGIVPVGPNLYVLAEQRAPVLGGGFEAHRAVLAEADGFCRRQGSAVQILDLRPDGDPFTPYYPTAFDVTFRCVPPGAAPAAAGRPGGAGGGSGS